MASLPSSSQSAQPTSSVVPASSSSASPRPSTASGGLPISVNAIVGIAIGGVLFIILVITIGMALRGRRRTKRGLPRHSVNLSNTDLFFSAASKSAAIKQMERDSQPDLEAPLLSSKDAESNLRVHVPKGVNPHRGGIVATADISPIYALSNPYDDFGKSGLPPRLPHPSFVTIENIPPRLLDSPRGVSVSLVPTPSPAPMYIHPKSHSASNASTPRAGITSLPPLAMPYTPPNASPTRSTRTQMQMRTPTSAAPGPIMLSAKPDESDAETETASLYSLPSAPASQHPSRSSTSLVSLSNLPPVPPIPAQYTANANSSSVTIRPGNAKREMDFEFVNSSSATIRPGSAKREMDFRDVGLPTPQPYRPSSPDEDVALDRSNTEFIGALLQQRAERVGSSLERSMSQVSHIERAGSIRAAGENGYGKRLARVREGSLKSPILEKDVEYVEGGSGTRSTKASVHSKWAAEGALRSVNGSPPVSPDRALPPLPLPLEKEKEKLTGAFSASSASPEPTPPANYPYLHGQDKFVAGTAPLRVKKP